jgi:hypothetical protein
MSFFYNLNDKLNAIREKPEVTHQQLNERDMSRAAKGYEKYGKEGMEKLAQAGRDGKALDPIRKKYDKYDNTEVDEGVMDTVKNVGKRVASGINRLVGHGSDEEMRKDLQRKSGAPVTGKKPQQQVKEKLSPAKQKSFAALAPPTDKITFADKIAGAKKEVDEMLGDVAAEAMRNALSPKQKKIDMNKNGKLDANDFAMLRKGAKPEMDEERSKGTAFDPDTPRAVAPKVGSIERGAKHDIKHTATGRMVTRRTDDQGNSVGADDDSDADAAPRGRGRPKGTKNVSSKAKVFQRKSKLMTKEGEDDPAEKGEYDREGDMALDDIDTIESAANELQSIIDTEDNLPEWVQSKINKAMDYLDTARDYMAAQGNDQEPIAEKAVSKQQQKFMGMARAMQKGEKIKGASKELKKVAKTMKPKDTEDFAKTKHKGLPDKVKSKKKEEDVEESTTSGSVATSTAAPKGGGGMGFGKGIYDSMNRELEKMISESMSINMSDSTEGGKSLTITATDEDALKLGMMLKNAGLGGGDQHGGDMHSHGEEPCATCGMPDCGCGDVQEAVDENSPDYPTNTEQADNNFGYSGGLNKPKTDVAGDGQTTVPNTAVHTQDEDALRRMMEMAGVKQAELEPWKETMKEEEEEEVEEDFLESIQRMRAIAGIQEAKKPDFLDMDKDGDKKEPMSKAVKDKEEKKVDESIFALTNQWKAYKG